jgi:hypothetical protein
VCTSMETQGGSQACFGSHRQGRGSGTTSEKPRTQRPTLDDLASWMRGYLCREAAVIALQGRPLRRDEATPVGGEVHSPLGCREERRPLDDELAGIGGLGV